MSDGIGAYLEQCRRRLARLRRLRLAGGGAAAVAVLSVAFAAAAAHLVPAESWILAARIVLYAMIAATVVGVAAHRVNLARAARGAERHLAAFDGRLSTWLDAHRRNPQPALLPQLARDAERVAAANPHQRVAPAARHAAPVVMALAAAALLAWLFAAAPESWRLSAQRLWLGEAFADTRPRVVVEPGDAVVPRGADVLVRARAHGFAASGLQVHAAFADAGGWEQAAMLPPASADAPHEFVLVAVTSPVDYYVASGGVRSDRYRIEVADLPVVRGLDVALEFPAWTRLPPRSQDHGDVAGVQGTRVRVRVDATAPLEDARLIVNGADVALDGDGAGEFAIDAAGTWRVAVAHRGETVPISDQFLIDVVEDEPPEVEFAFPGRDRSATAIEEVALRFRASDDFGVEALTARYAVNGGDWTEIGATQDAVGRQAEFGHVIRLEDIRVGDEARAVRPGDVLSLFAEAADHGSATRSALYFVDVRPFDKRYRERAGSGGGGGMAGEGGLELSDRQREIASATWNLILDRDKGTRAGDDLRDQTDLVAILQGTLLEQVETLVARAAGRRLDDEAEVEPFVAELTAAAEDMRTAAAVLAEQDLDQAVAPEQRALQHLLTAEASLRDVDVSFGQQSSGGGGGSAGRSLAELVDLELDPERNRYETPQTPRFGEQAESARDEWRRLTELARRQEELANRQGDAERTMPMSRWQLARLQRELETLRERLAGQRGEQSERQPGQGGAAAGGDADPGRPLTPGAEMNADLRRAIADIDQARDSIDRSLQRADAPDEESRRQDAEALGQGAAALRQGAEQILRASTEALAERMRRAQRDADRLVADQERIMERLDRLQDEVLRAARDGERLSAGRFGDDPLPAEAITKRRMQGDLARIAGELADAREALAGAGPANAPIVAQVDAALDELTEARVDERLAIAAEYFEYGRPLFMIGHEQRVADALASLRDRIGGIARRVAGLGGSLDQGPGVDDVQSLRRRLEAAGAGGDADELRAVAEAAERLAAQVRGGIDPEALRAMRASYRGLGASDANRERLYRLTLASLDRIEVELGRTDGAPLRAQRSRDAAYDDEAVARYFRRLSCGGDDC